MELRPVFQFLEFPQTVPEGAATATSRLDRLDARHIYRAPRADYFSLHLGKSRAVSEADRREAVELSWATPPKSAMEHTLLSPENGNELPEPALRNQNVADPGSFAHGEAQSRASFPLRFPYHAAGGDFAIRRKQAAG